MLERKLKSVRSPSLAISETTGRERASFPVTRWSLVLAAQGEPGGEKARQALTELAQMYREPVLAYVMAQGHSREAASGLVDEFFETLHAHEAWGTDRSGGQFRVWLLSALKEFLLE